MSAAQCTVAGLRAWGRDYDGNPLPADAEPMPGFTVGHIYDAADKIEELEKAVEEALTALCYHLGGNLSMATAREAAKSLRIALHR